MPGQAGFLLPGDTNLASGPATLPTQLLSARALINVKRGKKRESFNGEAAHFHP
jgi:hypothetical protein